MEEYERLERDLEKLYGTYMVKIGKEIWGLENLDIKSFYLCFFDLTGVFANRKWEKIFSDFIFVF
jgi:hypothetical protein